MVSSHHTPRRNIAHLLVSAPLHPVGSPVESNLGAVLFGKLDKLIKLLPKLSRNGNMPRLDFARVDRKMRKTSKMIILLWFIGLWYYYHNAMTSPRIVKSSASYPVPRWPSCHPVQLVMLDEIFPQPTEIASKPTTIWLLFERCDYVAASLHRICFSAFLSFSFVASYLLLYLRLLDLKRSQIRFKRLLNRHYRH